MTLWSTPFGVPLAVVRCCALGLRLMLIAFGRSPAQCAHVADLQNRAVAELLLDGKIELMHLGFLKF